MGARGVFDAAKHPRGFHGRFGSGSGVVSRSHDVPWSAPARGSGALIRTRMSASAERARKVKIKRALEVPRGIRPPASQSERNLLEWASPQKIQESIEKTGSKNRPKFGKGGSLYMTKWQVGGFRTNRAGTTGTYKTFTGKRRKASHVEGMRGAKQTTLGRFLAAKYGGG